MNEPLFNVYNFFSFSYLIVNLKTGFLKLNLPRADRARFSIQPARGRSKFRSKFSYQVHVGIPT